MLTLHYAERATISAKEKLTEAESELDFKNRVKQHALVSSNVSNTQLLFAKRIIRPA